ncbi:MAG: long-chain fatty acid--CoA ligase [Candidatus Cloacimonetes bacterium 4572_65]|nr:MAG: long-chain fatty acid--CoA ligase [Candidatus Cloacimonetes bacterium 4572_65]
MNDQLKKSIPEYIMYSINRCPEKEAVTWIDGKAITYKELGTKIEEVGLLLKARGIKAKDKVALLSENSPHWAIAYLAISFIGGVVVPILTEFHENEIHHIIRHSEAKAVFVSEKMFPKFDGIFGKDINLAINLDTFSVIPPNTTKEKLKLLYKEKRSSVVKKKEKLFEFIGVQANDIQEDDLAVIIYTSGTTGQSKGVMLTHKNLITNVLACYSLQKMTTEDRLISILPLPHTFEATLGFLLPLMCGSKIHYLKKPPTPRVLMPALAKIRPTIMLTVPIIMEKIFHNKVQPTFNSKKVVATLYKMPFFRKLFHQIAGKKLKQSFGGELKFFGIGGAKLAEDVELFLQDCNFPYAIGYGLTETAPLIAGASPSQTRFRSTGPVAFNLEHKLINVNPKTGEGELVVKGDSIMKGYYKDKERTNEVFTSDGFFKTGDLVIEKDNFIYVKGRLKNVIIGSSGENIYPEDIEAVINENKYVVESIVYDFNKRLVAKIHLNYDLIDEAMKSFNYSETRIKEEITKLITTIRKEVNSKVSNFSKLTKMIEHSEPFEKTPTLKIKRFLYT